MTISASLVRDLRNQTGAGMMDCKKALEAAAGDMQGAVDWLRKKGIKRGEKKADRATGEGEVFVHAAEDGRAASMVALACETDFATNTDGFQTLLKGLGAHVFEHQTPDADTLSTQTWAKDGIPVSEMLTASRGSLGENVVVLGCTYMANNKGHVVSYVHHNKKIGVMVSATTSADPEKAGPVLRKFCMHIASATAGAAEYLRRDEVPEDVIKRERAIFLEEVKGKPENIQEKIVSGKLDKFYAERAVLEQPWMHSDDLTVQKTLEKELGSDVKVESFAKFVIG